MPQEAWPGRGPWPEPATPALGPKQGLRSWVTRSLQIQVISPGSKLPSPPRSCARRSQAPTRKGHQHRCLQEPDLGRKMALAGCSWLLLSGEREPTVPRTLSPDGLGEGEGSRLGGEAAGLDTGAGAVLLPRGTSVGRAATVGPAGWAMEIPRAGARARARRPLLLLSSRGKP